MNDSEKEGLKSIQGKIDQLAAVIKSSMAGGVKSKVSSSNGKSRLTPPRSPSPKKNENKYAAPKRSGGPATMVTGSFHGPRKPMQCYNC